MKIELKKIVKPTAVYILLYALLAIVVWIATYIGVFYTDEISLDELLSKLPDRELVWKNMISFIFTLINSILLSRLINRFSFVGTRTFLPVFIFILLITVWEPVHVMYRSHAALFLFICALFQFLDISERHASERTFLGSLLISGAGLFMNDLIFIIPVCWLGFMILKYFSLRVFFASVMGVFTPWIIYASVMYITSPAFSLQELLNISFSLGFSMEELQLPTQIYIGLLFVVFFISFVGTYFNFYKQNNIVRKNINFMLILFSCFVIIFIFQKNFEGTFFPFIALCFAIFVSNIFSIKKNNFYSILFLVFLFVNIVFVAYNFLF